MQQTPHANERSYHAVFTRYPSIQTLKSEVKTLRDTRAAGQPLPHAVALEQISHAHGYRDWSTARASLPEQQMTPFQVGGRVKGAYLEQPFTGVLLGVQLLGDDSHFKLTVHFDIPVNVMPDFVFAALRQRVVATVDSHGVTPAMRGNGQSQMTVRRA
ncbi:MAG: glyoxalase superfamily protein [Candidatus Devosia euplotis]|nr:glyoxalase superfamily protein [Candidatus Devosia euplotis]